MSSDKTILGSVEVQDNAPTEFTFSELQDWVLWQFPRQQGGWLDAAAHPAEPQYGWLPARIQPLRRRVLLYANSPQPYDSPEEAARWIAESREF